LENLSDDFPEDFFKMKVLPELLKSVEFGGGGPKVFGVIIKISQKLTDEEFEVKITPAIVRLFGSPDRAIRVCLLDNLPHMIDRLPQKIVNDKIFPHIVCSPPIIIGFPLTILQVSGFTDLAPVVREQTVKAVLTIIGKLSDRTINGELLKYLAKTSNDEQPGIRTNTTICLGKISKNIGVGTRSKVLIAAFTRSLRDPFVHARNAALMALAATNDAFSEDDCASRILPAICPCLIDKEKLIRDQANKTIEAYLARVRKHASTMADSVLPPPTTGVATATTPRMGTPQPTEAASWTGWAISSFTNKVSAAAGEIEQNTNSVSQLRPNPPATRSAPGTASASTLHRQAVTSPPLASPHISTPTSAEEDVSWEPEDDGDAWGDMAEETFFDASDSAPKSGSSAANPFDDNGEPDFAGWLAAQNGKKPSTKPLPKGLAKSSANASRPGVGGRPVTTGSIGAKKQPVSLLKAKPVVVKKVDTAPKVQDDDVDWGDGW